MVADGAEAILRSESAKDCDVVVVTKSDLASSTPLHFDFPRNLPVVVTSSRTDEGLAKFSNVVRELILSDAAMRCGPVIAATAERCGESIRLAASSLGTATGLVESNAGDELVAAELRAALADLGKVVGAVYTDDLLDRIFRTFCIGK